MKKIAKHMLAKLRPKNLEFLSDIFQTKAANNQLYYNF